MKEIFAVAEAYENYSHLHSRAILATVIEVEGSSYRKPGARMLILPDGRTIGGVSGGCLEADIIERAHQVIDDGLSQIALYDSMDEYDTILGTGQGCRGKIKVFLESIEQNFSKSVSIPHSMAISQQEGVFARRIAIGLTADQIQSQSLTLQASGETVGDKQLLSKANEVLAQNRSWFVDDVFYEYLAAPVSLIIFGAGNDAVPLTRIGKEVGWQVTVVDHRPSFANSEHLPHGDSVILSNRENGPDLLELNSSCYVVVMTHHFEIDRVIVPKLLKSECAYVGLLGARHRTHLLLQEWQKEQILFSEQQLKKLHNPIGLHLGSENSEEIALSIAAEILSIYRSNSHTK